ncbi:MAG: response regulator [Polyangiaceae bacterium]|nr:response regulator [Polyangiaceae bacterium]
MPSTPTSQFRDRSSGSQHRLHVLVVDDAADVLESVGALLESQFSVELCSNSTEAFDRMLAKDYDVLCTDYQMPGMSGLDLVDALERRDVMIGVVLVTGRYERFAEARKSGGQSVPLSVLLKPYRSGDLLEAVRRTATFARMKRAVNAIGKRAPELVGE